MRDMTKRLSVKQLVALADEHIKLFTKRIEMARGGDRHFREAECELYRCGWISIKAKALSHIDPYPRFTRDEKAELADALSCGVYDNMLEAMERT